MFSALVDRELCIVTTVYTYVVHSLTLFYTILHKYTILHYLTLLYTIIHYYTPSVNPKNVLAEINFGSEILTRSGCIINYI